MKRYIISAIGALSLCLGIGFAVAPAGATAAHPARSTAAQPKLPPGTLRQVKLNPSSMTARRNAALAQGNFKSANNRVPIEKMTAHGDVKVLRDGTSCTSSGCGDVTNKGGPIQRHPQVYLLLWGSKWSGESTYTPELQNMMAGLGLENQNQSTGNADAWLSTTHQYGESDGSPWFYAHGILGAVGSTYATSYLDTSNPPVNVSQAGMAAEAVAFAKSEGITEGHQQTIIVATQQGTDPDPSSGACAYHTYAIDGSSNLPWIMLPYAPDEQGSCTPVNQPAEIYSAAAGHEIAETITSPLENGWNNNPGGEIADQCPGYSTATLGNGTSLTEQSLYSNEEADAGSAGTGCTYSSGPLGPIAAYVASGEPVNCLNNSGGTVSNGNNIITAACNLTQSSGQQLFTNDATSKHLDVQGKCIDDPNDGGNGTVIQLFTCNTNVQQMWTFVPDPTHPGYGQYKKGTNGAVCLHRFNTISTPMDVETCNTTVLNQLWGSPDQYNP